MEEASNDSGVVDNGNFHRPSGYFFEYFRDEASVIRYHIAIRSPSSAFQ